MVGTGRAHEVCRVLSSKRGDGTVVSVVNKPATSGILAVAALAAMMGAPVVAQDAYGLTPLQGKVWCSAALSYYLARGDFGKDGDAFDREQATAAVVYYDGLIAEHAGAEGLSVRDTLLMLNSDRYRFVAELQAPELDLKQASTRLVACEAIARFAGQDLPDFGFDVLLE